MPVQMPVQMSHASKPPNARGGAGVWARRPQPHSWTRRTTSTTAHTTGTASTATPTDARAGALNKLQGYGVHYPRALDRYSDDTSCRTTDVEHCENAAALAELKSGWTETVSTCTFNAYRGGKKMPPHVRIRLEHAQQQMRAEQMAGIDHLQPSHEFAVVRHRLGRKDWDFSVGTSESILPVRPKVQIFHTPPKRKEAKRASMNVDEVQLSPKTWYQRWQDMMQREQQLKTDPTVSKKKDTQAPPCNAGDEDLDDFLQAFWGDKAATSTSTSTSTASPCSGTPHASSRSSRSSRSSQNQRSHGSHSGSAHRRAKVPGGKSGKRHTQSSNRASGGARTHAHYAHRPAPGAGAGADADAGASSSTRMPPRNERAQSSSSSSSSTSSSSHSSSQSSGHTRSRPARVQQHGHGALSWVEEHAQYQQQLAAFDRGIQQGCALSFDTVPWPPASPRSVLGVANTSAADAALKKAFRKFALRWHPDKFLQKVGRCFDGINENEQESIMRQVTAVFQQISAAIGN